MWLLYECMKHASGLWRSSHQQFLTLIAGWTVLWLHLSLQVMLSDTTMERSHLQIWHCVCTAIANTGMVWYKCQNLTFAHALCLKSEVETTSWEKGPVLTVPASFRTKSSINDLRHLSGEHQKMDSDSQRVDILLIENGNVLYWCEFGRSTVLSVKEFQNISPAIELLIPYESAYGCEQRSNKESKNFFFWFDTVLFILYGTSQNLLIVSHRQNRPDAFHIIS